MDTQIYEYDLEALTALVVEMGQPAYRAKQLYEWLHLHNATSYDEMTNLPKALRERLAAAYPLSATKIAHRDVSRDGTRKYVFAFSDGSLAEAVGIPSYRRDDENSDVADGEPERLTVCFSTQVGCPMRCAFCATGKEGFTRNMTSQEMIDQIVAIQRDFGCRVSNLVAMGQGEPFLNYDAVLAALRRANSDAGLRIGARHITVSTCGIVEGVERFSEEEEQFTLAVSLHSALQQKRNRLMPQLEGQHLTKLRRALERYIMRRNRRVTLEYMLIEGVNDGEEDLAALLAFCDGLLCHVNLIGLNQVEGSPFKPSSEKVITHWLSALEDAHISATLRKSKGSDINGACGQLKNTISSIK